MAVKVNQVSDSCSSSRKDIGINWLKREMCQRQPTGISVLILLTVKHQQGWKDSLKSLGNARYKKNTTTGPDRRKMLLKMNSIALFS